MAAAVAASRELGPEYDDAVAAGLVERIGDEIDRRIDQRVGAAAAPARRRPEKPEGRRWRPVYTTSLFGGGSVAFGTFGTFVAWSAGSAAAAAVLWAVIALVNVAVTFGRDLNR